MTLKGSGRCEFTEFVSNHILCYIHGDMLASVMNSEGVADKFGKDCGAAAPGLENLLVAGLVHLHDSLEQFRLHERSFFNASAIISAPFSTYLPLRRFTISLSEAFLVFLVL